MIATFRLDLEGFALAGAFGRVPEMTVEAERIAAHSTEWSMPCVWIAADDFAAVETALAADPTVNEIVGGDAFGDEKHYHIDWTTEVHELITLFVDREGAILQAHATSEGWRLQMRFVTREQFESFRALLQRRDCGYELLALFEPGTPRQTAGDLTPAQRDALVAAVERGYYAIPRAISSRELAAQLDTSHQALSELLRRGTRRLVEATLMTGTPEARP